ncbi:MAG TPA: hypothetical protein VM487_09165, partial [Phycisphaerae bacterium]|nr:hypothetical protein [Phycisphaerae bacterium]
MLAEFAPTLLPSWLYTTLPFWPLLGAIVVGIMLAVGWQRHKTYWPVVLGVTISAVLAVFLFVEIGQTHAPAPPAGAEVGTWSESSERAAEVGETHTIFRWISFGSQFWEQGWWIEVNYFFDSLTAVMLVTVALVSLMVVIYSIGYMRDHHGRPERGYERFFAFMGLFVFSMCMLVAA